MVVVVVVVVVVVDVVVELDVVVVGALDVVGVVLDDTVEVAGLVVVAALSPPQEAITSAMTATIDRTDALLGRSLLFRSRISYPLPISFTA